MMLWLFIAIGIQATLSLVIDHPDSIVQGWSELKRTDPTQEIKLTFALKNQRVDGMIIKKKCICEYKKHMI